MSEQYLLVLSDTSPDANNSTSREIIDLLRECKRNSLCTIVACAGSVSGAQFQDATITVDLVPPFYKSNNLILRFISENYLSLFLAIKIRTKFKPSTVILGVAWISPSIFNVWAAWLIKQRYGAPIYLILRDLFPFWLSNIGVIRRNGFVFKLLKSVADLQMSLADRIGVESPKIISFFSVNYPKHLSKVEVLLNWITVKSITHTPKESGVLKFVYAGNMGQAQGSELFLALCGAYKNDKMVEIHFVGRGSEFDSILLFKKNERITNLIIHDELPAEQIDEFIRDKSIGLVFLKSDNKLYNIPGKFMSYLLNGLPVLAAVNPENDLVDIVERNFLGHVESSGDREEYLRLAGMMIDEVKSGFYDSKKCIDYGQSQFSSTKAFATLSSFLQECND